MQDGLRPIFDGLQNKINAYFAGKYQNWTAEGSPRTLKELLAEIRELYPEEVAPLLTAILAPLVEPPKSNTEAELGKLLVRDRVREQSIRQATRDFNLGYAWDLPDGVPGGKTLDQYIPREQYPTTGEAKLAVERWLRQVGPLLLTLAGTPGVGKSTLAIAAAQVLKDRGELILYRDGPGLMADLKAGIESRTMVDRLQAFSVVPWLVLDDVGVEAPTEWSREVLDRLVDARWQSAVGRLRTLLATNLKSKDFSPRIASRLRDVQRGLVVQIVAADYRSDPPSTEEAVGSTADPRGG